jgi:hypothetical protein
MVITSAINRLISCRIFLYYGWQQSHIKKERLSDGKPFFRLVLINDGRGHHHHCSHHSRRVHRGD